jgi:hypothetical protein
MAEIKGKFITLAASLMGIYAKALEEVDQELFKATGKHWNELDPEGWYGIAHYNNFMLAYAKASPTGERAMVTLGKNVYPTIKRTVGFPPGLETPVDYIKFESRGYIENVRGPEVNPRQFLKQERGHVIVQTRMLEQDCLVLEGVYQGILGLAGVQDGKVEQKKCIKQGDDTCEFHITW